MNHKITYKNLDEIQAAPLNPKRHDLDALVRSVTRFGFVAPALLDETAGRLVAGHGRIEAVRRIRESGAKPPRGVKTRDGAWLVPVVSGLSFSPEEAEAYVIADNRMTELGGWDAGELNTLLGKLALTDIAIEDVGFSVADLQALEVEASLGGLNYDDPVVAKPDRGGGGSGSDTKEAELAPDAKKRYAFGFTVEQHARFVDLMSRAMKSTGLADETEIMLRGLESIGGT